MLRKLQPLTAACRGVSARKDKGCDGGIEHPRALSFSKESREPSQQTIELHGRVTYSPYKLKRRVYIGQPLDNRVEVHTVVQHIRPPASPWCDTRAALCCVHHTFNNHTHTHTTPSALSWGQTTTHQPHTRRVVTTPIPGETFPLQASFIFGRFDAIHREHGKDYRRRASDMYPISSQPSDNPAQPG